MIHYKVAFRIAATLLFGSCVFTACFNNEWTPQQRKDFETACDQTDTFNNTVFMFYGFGNDEFDSVLVKDYVDSALVDSFKVFVSPAQSPDEKERKVRSATVEQTMNIHHRYLFVVPGQKPFELSDMKMVKWAQYSMTSEGWGCVMGDFTIDGERFEHNANPTFVKRK